jgi:hypothetical protein
MNTSARWISTATLAGVLAFMAVGCGDTPSPPKGADAEISAARSMVDSGDSAVRSRDYPRAISMYKGAKDKIEEARSKAKESELSAVKSLTASIREKIDDAELKQVTDKVEPKVPVVTEVKKQEDAEAKQKAEEAKKKAEEEKKIAAAREKNEKLLSRKDSSGSKQDEDPAVAKSGGDKGGDKKGPGEDKKPAGDDADAGPAKPEGDPAIAPAKPPYPAVTDKSPEVQIIKIATKGNFVYAYFQLFNKTEDDRRINVINAFFKDKDNQTMIDHGAVTFPFEGFKLDTHKDMIGEQVIDALTLGSDVVAGRGVRRYVVVGEHDRAKDIKKVALQVVWQSGNPSVETGP